MRENRDLFLFLNLGRKGRRRKKYGGVGGDCGHQEAPPHPSSSATVYLSLRAAPAHGGTERDQHQFRKKNSQFNFPQCSTFAVRLEDQPADDADQDVREDRSGTPEPVVVIIVIFGQAARHGLVDGLVIVADVVGLVVVVADVGGEEFVSGGGSDVGVSFKVVLATEGDASNLDANSGNSSRNSDGSRGGSRGAAAAAASSATNRPALPAPGTGLATCSPTAAGTLLPLPSSSSSSLPPAPAAWRGETARLLPVFAPTRHLLRPPAVQGLRLPQPQKSAAAATGRSRCRSHRGSGAGCGLSAQPIPTPVALNGGRGSTLRSCSRNDGGTCCRGQSVHLQLGGGRQQVLWAVVPHRGDAHGAPQESHGATDVGGGGGVIIIDNYLIVITIVHVVSSCLLFRSPGLLPGRPGQGPVGADLPWRLPGGPESPRSRHILTNTKDAVIAVAVLHLSSLPPLPSEGRTWLPPAPSPRRPRVQPRPRGACGGAPAPGAAILSNEEEEDETDSQITCYIFPFRVILL